MSENDVEKVDSVADAAPATEPQQIPADPEPAAADSPAPAVETDDAPADSPLPAAEAEDVPAEDAPADEIPPLEAEDLAAVEAILFTTDSPLSPAKIADVAGLPGGRKSAREAIEQLNDRYQEMGCSFRIESHAGGYRMLTLPEYNELLSRLLKVRNESKLSQASLETLAIVAYRQPILRADIEAIRGVASGELVRGLMEKGLVKIVGRAEEIGRPMLYGTTKKFLEVFGINSLKDLPEVAELAAGVQKRDKAAPADRDAEKETETEGSADPPKTADAVEATAEPIDVEAGSGSDAAETAEPADIEVEGDRDATEAAEVAGPDDEVAGDGSSESETPDPAG